MKREHAVTVLTPNRSLFREVNERIRDVSEAFSLRPDSYELVCECDSASCLERIEVPRTVFEDVLLAPGTFLVHTGHEHDDRLLTATSVYSVVSLAAATAAAV